MWGIWAFPLLAILFVGGSAAGLAWFLASRKGRRPNIAAVIAIPFGCVAIPVAGFVMLAVIDNLFQSSDTELYEEVFGYRPTITEDRMLFDDFGSGRNREIFMRAEPTETERNRLFAIPDAVESDFTLNDFVARGASRGFSWWLSGDGMSGGFCKSARILDAHGFRGWVEFRIAECLDAGTEFPASADKGKVYVIASGRTG
ncbi:MAG TPA: hypothetical protein VEA61_06710 [Allosphingosinicella sp.]|nr:hypothetical protein [Allosphingosinicella sp.]